MQGSNLLTDVSCSRWHEAAVSNLADNVSVNMREKPNKVYHKRYFLDAILDLFVDNFKALTSDFRLT